MKLLHLIAFFFLSCLTLLAAEATIDDLRARSDSRTITVEWRVSRETDVVRYEIERSAGAQSDFKKVGTVTATGSQASYRFIDDNAYLRTGSDPTNATIQSAALYSYRLKIVGSDEKFTYTNPVNVTHTVSSVRRTWGMIKEMFR